MAEEHGTELQLLTEATESIDRENQDGPVHPIIGPGVYSKNFPMELEHYKHYKHGWG